MLVSEEHLFWLVLLAFMAFDNAVLLPQGVDFLRVGYTGVLRYDARPRITVMARDLVFSNPFHPYDRVLITSRVAGGIDAKAYAVQVRKVRADARVSNRLSHLGAVYCLVLASHLAATALFNGGVVILSLLTWHLALWCVAAALLVSCRAELGLERGRLINLLVEHLLVPGYMPQLGKRFWSNKRLELPALAVGLRQAIHQQRMGAIDALFVHRLRSRLDEVGAYMGRGCGTDVVSPEMNSGLGVELTPWFGKAEQCLKTLMQPDG